MTILGCAILYEIEWKRNSAACTDESSHMGVLPDIPVITDRLTSTISIYCVSPVIPFWRDRVQHEGWNKHGKARQGRRKAASSSRACSNFLCKPFTFWVNWISFKIEPYHEHIFDSELWQSAQSVWKYKKINKSTNGFTVAYLQEQKIRKRLRFKMQKLPFLKYFCQIPGATCKADVSKTNLSHMADGPVTAPWGAQEGSTRSLTSSNRWACQEENLLYIDSRSKRIIKKYSCERPFQGDTLKKVSCKSKWVSDSPNIWQKLAKMTFWTLLRDLSIV